MPSVPLEHHLPIPLFPLCRQNTSAIRHPLRGPCGALLHFLRFIRFLRNDLSVKTSDGSRWLDQVKDGHAQSKSSSKLPSLCSTQPHIRGPPTNPSLLLWRGQPVCRGSCKSSPELESGVHLQPHHAQLRKKRNKSKKEPVWRSSTGASGLPR